MPEDRIAALEEELRRQRVINDVLIQRVEREMDPAASSAFSLFFNTVTVDSSVSQRTATLTNLARRLMQEIAERKEAEAASLEAKAAAEQANESKTNFLAAVSHDLRQPLHAARLFLGEIAQGELPERATALVVRVEAALDAMDDMLESLLDMARLDSGAWRMEPETIALTPLLTRLAGEIQPEAVAAGLRLRHVAADLAVCTDRRLLERMLRNLLGNAVRYTDKGGVVIGCRRRGANVRIDVVDSGIGIPRDKWQLIFQEFQQLGLRSRQSGKGLGLGLAVVDRAARLTGATVELFSKPGRGSRFSITLPMVDLPPPAAPAVPAPPVTAAPLVPGGGSVLVIEDDASVREGMCSLLRSWQCQVTAAASTNEALAALRAQRLKPQVVIADYHLDESDFGTGAIRAVRALTGVAMPALLMSSDRAPEVRDGARDLGAVFLLKPVAPSKLRATLTYLFGQVASAADTANG
jgi:signal transduction histidine kinase